MTNELVGVTDFIFTSGTEPFGAESLMCLNITIIDDELVEDEERFVVCGCSSQPGVVLLDGGCTDVFIEDNDRGKKRSNSEISLAYRCTLLLFFASFHLPLIY
jgi:hypothetical protein